jgi:membrane fusion protein (multidrug efflux system)
MMKKIVGTISISLLILTLFCCKNKSTNDVLDMNTSGKGDTAIPVKVAPVIKGSISAYIETTTTLEPEKEVDILSRTSGLVIKLLVEEGDYVRKDQILLKIDEREVRAAYNSSLATFEERKQQWARAQETFEKKIVSKEAYDQARYNFAKAEADLETSKLRLEYADIRAPFTGVITERLINPGSMLSVNQKIFKIVDTDPLLAKIYLPERELTKVTAGQEAALKLEAYAEKSFDAKIKMINPVVDPSSGTFKVTLEVASSESLLRPGMFASVYLVTETHNDALLVPKQALLLEAEKDTIFYVDGKFAYSREVKVGFRDDKNIEILDDDIKVGMYVVVVGQDGITSGTEVKLFDLNGKEIKVQAKKEFSLDELE